MNGFVLGSKENVLENMHIELLQRVAVLYNFEDVHVRLDAFQV